jgi:hypothetical protein
MVGMSSAPTLTKQRPAAVPAVRRSPAVVRPRRRSLGWYWNNDPSVRQGAVAGGVLLLGVLSASVMLVFPQFSRVQEGASDALRTVVAPLTGGGTSRGMGSDAPLPVASGEGRRIVFDQSDQRVWLVDDDDIVERTYLVSGSKLDNLQPGSYRVESRSRHADAFDGSGTMEYFVRFATGRNAPIGFHTVPLDHGGRLEQTREALGTPQSAGCVRQWLDDAVALWEFAPIGTNVVVTA